MSRGLGRMQREILASLDEAGALHWVDAARYPADCRDLRAVLHVLAKRHGMTFGQPHDWPGFYIHDEFRVSFSRAVRTLIERGHLQICGYDGNTRRFVRRCRPPPDTPKPVDDNLTKGDRPE